MKRGGPLNPGKGFKPRTSQLRRAGALRRQSERTREAAAKPRKPLVSKPKPVTAEEKRARRLVKARSNECCEGCDMARAAHMSHRIAEGQGGPWCPSNLMHLCAACHLVWAHANPTDAKAAGWIVHPNHDHTVIPVRHALHGLVLLDCDGGWTTYSEEAA